ncbi:hypothetical protein EV2_034198 [Malus domestica]
MSLHSHHGARQPQSHTQKHVMERCGWINSMPPDVNTSSVLEFEIVILNELGCWDSNVLADIQDANTTSSNGRK